MSGDSELKKRVLVAATAILMVSIFVVGILSTGFLSAICGAEPTAGTYCARISQGRFPVAELLLILAPTIAAARPGAVSVRRRSARPLLTASVPLLVLALLLPFVVELVWR